MAKTHDIVCGMEVDTETAVSAEYKGKQYYFCCDGCKGAFEKAADYYIEEWEKEHGKEG
jgi:YHS domain-containing protein